MPKNEIRIGGTLKTLIEEKGVTQYRAAKDSGIDHAAFSKILNDKIGVSVTILLKLANYFSVSTDRILGRKVQ